MLSAVHLAFFSAALLAITGALFGVCIARLLWADDLRFTQSLKTNWDGSRKAMEGTIAALQKTVDLQRQTIELQKRRLGE